LKVMFSSPVPHRNSAQVLGVQTSEALRKIGLSANFCHFNDLKSFDSDIIVFCKFFDADLARWAKTSGRKTVWFPDESLFGPIVPQALASQHYIDCIISTCKKYSSKIREVGFKSPKTEIIHHHHCNFNNETVSLREKVKTVAYVGEPTQMHCVNELSEMCEDLGVRFVMKREKAKDLEDFEDIDVAVAFIDSQSSNDGLHIGEKTWQDRLDYRSNCKIVNYAAFGIPSVLSRYESYLEVARPYDKFCLFANTPEEFLSQTKRLIEDFSLRKRLRENGLKMRDDYHIDTIRERYIKVFKGLSVL